MKRKNLFVSLVFIVLCFLTADLGAQLLPSSSLKDAGDEATLQNWLGSNYYGVKIYTKSIDGASGSIFHQKCNGQGPTITLIRNSQNNVVFGGYSNGDWSGYPNAGGAGSFVFNLSTNTKLDYIGPGFNATNSYTYYGPIFNTSFEISSDMSQMYGGNSHSYFCNSGYAVCADLLYNAPGQNVASYSNWISVGEIEVYKVVSNDVVTLNLVQPNIISQCPGSTIAVNYNVLGNFTENSQYDVQWSNEFGVFATNPAVSEVVSINQASGIINLVIPANVVQNGNYKVRLKRQLSGSLSNPINVGIKSMFSVGFDEVYNQNGGFLCPGTNYQIPVFLSDCITSSNLTLTATLTSTSLGFSQVVGTMTGSGSVIDVNLPSNLNSATDYRLLYQLSYANQNYTLSSNTFQVGNRTIHAINNPTSDFLCTGVLYTLNYTYLGCDLSFDNQFIVELSDAVGSFQNPISVGLLSSFASSGTISFSILEGQPSGTGYKLRVRPTGMPNGVWTGSNNLTLGLLGSIAISLVTPGVICPGVGALNYTTTSACSNSYQISNVFNVQLSDAQGSFSAPSIIGSLTTSDPSGTINFTIPNNIVRSSSYKIRLVSTSPSVTSSTINASIGMTISTNVSSTSSTCIGSPLSFTFNTGNCLPLAGNVYTLQSFSSSTNTWTNVATLASTATTGTLTYTIPSTWTEGYYTFRVTSSLPQSIGGTQVYLYQKNASIAIDDWNVGISGSQCAGGSITVPFIRMATAGCVLPATTGNIYRVQISNDPSFTNPIVIGSLSSTANSGNITATIPAGYQGQYYLRVIGTAPATDASGYATRYVGPQILDLTGSLVEGCPGQSRTFGYSNYPGCTFGSGNQIIYELGDASGNFTNPTVLATYTTSLATANHTFTIPASVVGGMTYTIRARSTNPVKVSDDYSIFIGRKTTITSVLQSNYCTGTNYTHAYSYVGCTLAAGNVFTAEICANQDFSSTIYTVGSLSSTSVTGNVVVNIPSSVPAGNYFLRIKTTTTTGAAYTTYPIVVNGLIIDSSVFSYPVNCGIPNYLPYTITSCITSNPSIQVIVDISTNFSAASPVIHTLYSDTVNTLTGSVPLSLPINVPLGGYYFRARAISNGITSQQITWFYLESEVQINNNLIYGSNYWNNQMLNTYCGSAPFVLPQVTYYNCGLTTINQFSNFSATWKLQNLTNPSEPEQVIQTYSGSGVIPSTNFTISGNLNPGDIYRFILSPSTTVWAPVSWEFIVTEQMTLTLPAGGNTFCPGSIVPLMVAMCSYPNSSNPLQVQLSNSIGQFDNVTVLSTMTFQQFLNPPFNVQLPSNLIIGSNYFIRIKDTVTGWTSNSLSIPVNGALTVTGVASNYCQGQSATLTYNYSCNLPANNQFEVFITNTTKANSILLGTVNASNNSGTLSIAIPNSFTGGVGFKLWIRSLQNVSCQSELSTPFGIGLNTSLSYSGAACRGITFPINYIASGCSLNPGNVFQVMMGETVVGSLLSNQPTGTIDITIPANFTGNPVLRLVTSSPIQVVAQSYTLNVQAPIVFNLPSTICAGSNISIPYSVNCTLPTNNVIQVYNGNQLIHSVGAYQSGTLNFSLPLQVDLNLKFYIVSSSYNLLVQSNNVAAQSYTSAFNISATPDFIAGCGTSAQLLVSSAYPTSYSDNFETGPGAMWEEIVGDNVYYTAVWNSGSGWWSDGYYSYTYYYNHCAASGTRSLLFTESYNRWATTKPMNVSNGGTVAFKLKISGGTSEGCENADLGEEVQLQYSLDFGSTWVPIATYNTTGTYNNLTAVSVPIPNAAKSFATMFRWEQLSCNEYEGDNWVLDDVVITGSSLATFPCTWDNASTLSNATIANPIANPNSTTTYSVSVNAVNFACPVVKSITVTTANQIGVDLTKFTFFGTSGGKNYYSSDQQAPWTTANSDCINSCGNLVSINSAAEQAYVQTILPSNNKWIGASDATTEGTFVWTTGQTFSTYTNWVSGTTTATGNSATNDHVQMNLSTGKWQVGLGSTNQYYILEKPANQSIQISSNVPLSYCSGSQLTIGYTIQGVFDSGNVFSVQLSNASGSFANPQVIGSISEDNSGTILVTLPSVVNSSSGYRMRIVSTSPAVISPDNGANIQIVGTNPVLVSLSANAAQSGNQLTLFGTGFANSGNTVLMSNQTVAIVSESSTEIVVVIPGGICPGDVQVITGCGTITNSLPFDPLSIPVISSTSEAIVGGLIQVSIVGYGFGYSNNLIDVSGTSYTPVFQSPNLIKFNMSEVVCGQTLTVTNSCGIVSNNFNYSTQLAPVVTSISPSAFAYQDQITISGDRFASGNIVTFGGVNCLVLSESETSLTVQLPSGICSGIFNVTNGCGVSVQTGNYSATVNVNTYYADADEDDFGNINNSITSCYLPAGYVSNSTDCNDASATVYPGATETCNTIDDDCDGTADEGVQTTFYADADNDTYGDLATTTSACAAPTGYVSNSTDCNDASAAVNPGATETCNSIDDDCDGSTDEGVQTTFYADADGDTYGNLTATLSACSEPTGFVANSTDCNDASASVHPGATETCNGVDDDCDGSMDEGVQTTFYADADSDTYGDLATTTSACTAPAGYVSNNTDCNDASATVYPGATETCNSIDDDCDGSTDEGVQTTFYIDADTDTYGNIVTTTLACSVPAGYSENSTDCDDTASSVYPGAIEACNSSDDDCDALTDEGVQITFYIDADNDTYGDNVTTTLACSVPAGYSVNSEDCDDSAIGVNPGATEVCGGTDEDCDGQQNEGLTFYNYYADNDGDSYAGTLIGNNCFTPAFAGYFGAQDDCDDENPSTYPTAIELCYNFIDDNCNGLINEGCGNLILGDDIYSSMSVSIANQFGTGAQPTSVLNLNMATDSPESFGAGSDMWILATPSSNAMRISLSGSASVQDDNEISIYTYQSGLVGPMIPLMVEDAVQPNNLGVSLDGGNEVLLTDQLVPGVPIWICVRNTNGIPGVCKLQIANLQGSQTDIGPYTQYTGIYSNVCQNFKVKFRPKAIGYIVHRLENLDVNSNTTWLYAIPSGSGTVATTVCQLGKLVPANLTANSMTYYFKVDVNYSLKDAFGNDHLIMANGVVSGAVGLNPESDLFLRSTDQCPVYKSVAGSIATNRSVCGSSNYNWSFTQIMPSPSPFDVTVSGTSTSRILPISVIPGIGQNQVYDVRVRSRHLNNIEYTNWGSYKCLRTIASAGMPLEIDFEQRLNSEAIVYPNPNGGEMFILVNYDRRNYSQCQLYNQTGQLVKSWNLTDEQSEFRLNDELASGIYQIRLTGSGKTQLLRLIIAK